MNKQELLKALESIGMRPGRGLGQNFLLDGNMLDSIVKMSSPKSGERILEVGPGFGALTKRLLKKNVELYAVEFDHRIAEYLRENIQKENFHLTENDACRVNYVELLGNEPFRTIANLPYSISSIFVIKMLELPNPPEEMYFMLQKEMAERLSAKIGTKSYGALSVRTQFTYNVKIEKIVPPNVFFPAPEVDSAIASFKRHHIYDQDSHLTKHFSGIVKSAFAHRRKQMGKVLSGVYGKDIILSAFEKLSIPLEIRPDKVDVATFLELTKLIFPTKE